MEATVSATEVTAHTPGNRSRCPLWALWLSFLVVACSFFVVFVAFVVVNCESWGAGGRYALPRRTVGARGNGRNGRGERGSWFVWGGLVVGALGLKLRLRRLAR